MPPTSPTGEEVVEKRASAPVSTACLIIACAALLGGIIFQVLEIAEYRSGSGDPKDQASKRYKTDVNKLKEQVEDILSKTHTAGTDTGSPADPAGSPTPPGETKAPADPDEGAGSPPETPPSGEAKDSPPPTDADPATDTKADGKAGE